MPVPQGRVAGGEHNLYSGSEWADPNLLMIAPWNGFQSKILSGISGR
jgi:hypothetical protein